MKLRAIISLLAIATMGAAPPLPTATLTVPSGWQAVPPAPPHGTQIMLNQWVFPGVGAVPSISLTQIPGTAYPYAEFLKSTEATLVKMGTVSDSHAEKLCDGKLDGWFIASKIVLGTHTYLQERILTTSGGMLYLVIYARPADQAEDASARKALDTLCVK